MTGFYKRPSRGPPRSSPAPLPLPTHLLFSLSLVVSLTPCTHSLETTIPIVGLLEQQLPVPRPGRPVVTFIRNNEEALFKAKAVNEVGAKRRTPWAPLAARPSSSFRLDQQLSGLCQLPQVL